VSLLLSEGHAHARQYPVWMVLAETRFVRQRISDRIATDTIALHTAVTQVVAGGKGLQEFIEGLRDGN
jgi:hypothetical protein